MSAPKQEETWKVKLEPCICPRCGNIHWYLAKKEKVEE